jgi:fido (protein-threonine AMPylation protein)
VTCPHWKSDDASERTKDHEAEAIAARDALVSAIATGNLRVDDVLAVHGRLFAGVAPPMYVGKARGQGKCLNVLATAHQGLGRHWDLVAGDLQAFCDAVNAATATFTSRTLDDGAVEELAQAIGHALGNLMRTHPFINGNGRTLRVLWSAWLLALRVGSYSGDLTARPSADFDNACRQAMQKRYDAFVSLVLRSMG